MELLQEMEIERAKLQQALRTLRNNGQAFAKAEHDYKIAVSKKTLELRDAGVPATVINLVIYGLPEVVELRLNRDIAQTVYEANQEAINVQKLILRLLEAQIQREWSINE